MKLFILFLILAGFIQTSFAGLNLCLVLLICRSFIVRDQLNLIMAFVIGIFLGILSAQNIGFWALVFLLAVEAIQVVKTLPILDNAKTLLPVSLLVVTMAAVSEAFLFGQSMNFTKILWETLLSLPIFLLLRFWEERFIVTPGIKLRI